MKLKSVIFDMDGTLLDTLDIISRTIVVVQRDMPVQIVNKTVCKPA